MSILETTKNQQDWALAIVRVIIGVIFVAHGSQKLFTYGISGVAGGFGQMGIPLAGIAAPLVSFLEFFGGLALIAGFLTRLVSLGLVINMIGAIAFAHLSAGFFMPKGYEFALVLGTGSLALAIAGGGLISLDSVIASRRKQVTGTR